LQYQNKRGSNYGLGKFKTTQPVIFNNFKQNNIMENVSLIFQVVVAISVYYIWIFRFHNVIAEFKQFGYSDLFRNFVGAAKMSISSLLIMGLCFNEITLPAALGMAFFMLSAQLKHLQFKNPFKQRLPSLIFLLMSLFIAAFSYGLL